MTRWRTVIVTTFHTVIDAPSTNPVAATTHADVAKPITTFPAPKAR